MAQPTTNETAKTEKKRETAKQVPCLSPTPSTASHRPPPTEPTERNPPERIQPPRSCKTENRARAFCLSLSFLAARRPHPQLHPPAPIPTRWPVSTPAFFWQREPTKGVWHHSPTAPQGRQAEFGDTCDSTGWTGASLTVPPGGPGGENERASRAKTEG